MINHCQRSVKRILSDFGSLLLHNMKGGWTGTGLAALLLAVNITIIRAEILPIKIDHLDLLTGHVNTIIQDNSGLIWFGCENGLVRYDGYHFEIFRQDSGHSLQNVQDLISDEQGGIWGTILSIEMSTRQYSDTTESGEIMSATYFGRRKWELFRYDQYKRSL